MKSLILTLTVISLYSFLVFASGTMQLDGTIVSRSVDKIELNDGFHIYTLLKDKLKSNTKIDLTKLKTGQTISLILPFDAIESTKAVNKKE